MRLRFAIGVLLLPMTLPAHAQHGDHSLHTMPEAQSVDPHAGHQQGSDPSGPPVAASASPTDHAADRLFDPATMAAARAQLRKEHGDVLWHMIQFDIAEYQFREGGNGYRWAGEASYGGDINRLVIKTEGEGRFGDALESAELQTLYSRAIGPYFDMRAGVRHDFRPQPSRTYATIGLHGLAPYWLELEGALFLSNKGDLLGRLESYYDLRVTQRLIVQPRAELDFAAQDIPETGIGAGLSDIEIGLRIRYEIDRQFAPYVGVTYERKAGDTADFARAAGEGVGSTRLALGIRTWF